MESAWEVSQLWAVTTNTTMTAISETLCQTHTDIYAYNHVKTESATQLLLLPLDLRQTVVAEM